MTIFEKLQEEQKQAMKAKDAFRLQVIRGMISSIKNKQIDTDHDMTDEEMQKVIATQKKQVTDALQDFQSAGREDLVENAKNEIAILASFLPEQLSEEEILDIIRQTVAEAGKENMGMLMGAVMKKVEGRADGGVVRTLVQKCISE